MKTNFDTSGRPNWGEVPIGGPSWFFHRGAMTITGDCEHSPITCQEIRFDPAGVHIIFNDGHRVDVGRDWVLIEQKVRTDDRT